MKRRVVVQSAAALAAPWFIDSARAAARRIGVLYPEPDPGTLPSGVKEFWARLGWAVGENLLIERRYAGWRAERMPDLLDDLLRRQGAELLITDGPDASAAAARATRTVPIVFRWAHLPIDCGLIDSYARPGRNCTGVTLYTGLEMVHKRLEFLRSASPSARRLAILTPDLSGFTITGAAPLDVWSETTAAAKATGFEYTHHMARRIEDVDAAMAEAAAAGAQVAVIAGSPYSGAASRVAEFALRQRWVTATSEPALFDAGMLLLQTSSEDLWNRTAAMTDRILRGAKPADIPVELAQPGVFLNLRIARALGLVLPPALLLRADRIIE